MPIHHENQSQEARCEPMRESLCKPKQEPKKLWLRSTCFFVWESAAWCVMPSNVFRRQPFRGKRICHIHMSLAMASHEVFQFFFSTLSTSDTYANFEKFIDNKPVHGQRVYVRGQPVENRNQCLNKLHALGGRPTRSPDVRLYSPSQVQAFSNDVSER